MTAGETAGVRQPGTHQLHPAEYENSVALDEDWQFIAARSSQLAARSSLGLGGALGGGGASGARWYARSSLLPVLR